ncbi:MAG: hypothetical protein KDK91_18560, partial [Gammaproteobacteria bacterium]|nr:hypothetical protein [Gammaproteobacteria bacterium]
LALCEHVLGFARSTWVLTLFALLSQLAAFALGRRLGLGAGDEDDPRVRARGWLLGLVAAAGLALHPLDLWISCFPVTENLARAALLGSAALALEAEAAERRGQVGVGVLAILAGLVFSLGVFARGSMLALAIVLAPLLILAAPSRSRRFWLPALVLGSTAAAMQAIVHSWPYFFSAASNHFHVPRIQPRIGEALAWSAVAGAAVLAAAPLFDRLRRRWPVLDRLAAASLWGLGLLALLGAFAAAAYRALDQGDAYGPTQQVSSVLWRHGGPAALLLGLVGLAVAAARSRRAASSLTRVLVALACVVVMISALKEGVRYEFYYARYLVGDAIPVLTVAAAWLLVELVDRARARWGPRVAPLVLAVLTLAWWVPPLRVLSRPVYWSRDLADDPEGLAAMFESVPDDAVLIFDHQEPLRWRGYLATPAFLSFGRNVLIYPNGALIERALVSNTPVYMISGGWVGQDRQLWPGTGPWRTTVVARGHYRALRAEVVEGAMPERMHEWGGPWELHRFDRSIWRGTGALSLMPGSSFVARDEPGVLASEVLPLRWQQGAAIELLLASVRAAEGCELSAALREADGREEALVRVDSDRPNLLRFAMPPIGPAPAGETEASREAALVVRWACPEARALPWRRLSMRWER